MLALVSWLHHCSWRLALVGSRLLQYCDFPPILCNTNYYFNGRNWTHNEVSQFRNKPRSIMNYLKICAQVFKSIIDFYATSIPRRSRFLGAESGWKPEQFFTVTLAPPSCLLAGAWQTCRFRHLGSCACKAWWVKRHDFKWLLVSSPFFLQSSSHSVTI